MIEFVFSLDGIQSIHNVRLGVTLSPFIIIRGPMVVNRVVGRVGR